MADSVFENSDCDLPVVPPVPPTHMLTDNSVPSPPNDIPDCETTLLAPLPPDPPCPPITVGEANISVIPADTPTVIFTIIKGDKCDYEVNLDIGLPGTTCASVLPLTTQEQEVVFAEVLVVPMIKYKFEKTPDACEYELEILELKVPCPPLLPVFLTPSGIGTPTEVPIPFALTDTGALSFVFVKPEDSCEYELTMEATAPCPFIGPADTAVITTTWNETNPDVGNIYYQVTPGANCSYTIGIALELPCVQMLPHYADAEEQQVDLDPDDTPYGQLKFGFTYSEGCVWTLRIDLKTGCMPVLPLTETPYNDINYTKTGYAIKYHFIAGESECKKTFEVTKLNLPCFPEPIINASASTLAPGAEPTFTATYSTDSGCQATWTFAAGMPPGAQGYQGYQGNDGAQGWQGWQGMPGDMGPQGWQGMNGNQGDPGQQGFQGWQGEQGNQGFQGAQGDKLAIVKYEDRYIGLACVEMGEPRFEEVLTIKVPDYHYHAEQVIDPRYVAACEPGSLIAVSSTTNVPAMIGLRVDGNRVHVLVETVPSGNQGLVVVVKLSGIRRDHNWRFKEFTEQQYRRNLKFWGGWDRDR